MTASQIWNHLLLSPLLLYCQGKNFEWLWAVSTTSHNTVTIPLLWASKIASCALRFSPYWGAFALRTWRMRRCGSSSLHPEDRVSSGRKWVGKRKSAEKDQKSTRLQDYNILQYTTIYYNILQYTTIYYNILQYTTRQFYRKVFLQGGLIAPNGYSQRHWRKLKPNPISRAPPSAVQDLLSGEITSMVQPHRIQVYLQFADHAREACSIQNWNPYNSDNTWQYPCEETW